MSHNTFKPQHINATTELLQGNHGLGRYCFLPGSDARAKAIADHFLAVTTHSHPRGHHLYTGQLNTDTGTKIDVAAISTGMGCPSMEIILHELYSLGAKRFLRVSTTGSLQAKHVKIGDIVNASASVRDEATTKDYIPIEFPAVASPALINHIQAAAVNLALSDLVHTGIVHCKSSFYAREFGVGPQKTENLRYLKLLQDYGVLATEMETAALFVKAQLYRHELLQKRHDIFHNVYAGAVLGVIATPEDDFTTKEKQAAIIDQLIKLAIETIKLFAIDEFTKIKAKSTKSLE